MPSAREHRELLQVLVADIIETGIARDDVAGIRERIEVLADPTDVDDVLALTINEVHQLHEGNIARYRVRPSRFRDWLALQGKAK